MPNPAQPARRGDPRPHPGRAPGVPTKEAATTHRIHAQPTPPAPGTAQGGTGLGGTGLSGTGQATGDPTPRRAAGVTPAGAHPGGRQPGRQMVRRLVVVGILAGALVVVAASPAYAAGGGTQTLSGLISNLTTWIVGILAGVATLFLTIGGLRYLTAGGDPGQVEKAKTALKSAAVGYALAVLAPLIVSILASLVGGG